MNFLNVLLAICALCLAFMPGRVTQWAQWGSFSEHLQTFAIPMIIAFIIAQKMVASSKFALSAWSMMYGITTIVFVGLIGLLLWDRVDCLNDEQFRVGQAYLKISFCLLCFPSFVLALSTKREAGFAGFAAWISKNFALSATPIGIISIVCIVGARCFFRTLGSL